VFGEVEGMALCVVIEGGIGGTGWDFACIFAGVNGSMGQVEFHIGVSMVTALTGLGFK
jgi:hypothetical protein